MKNGIIAKKIFKQIKSIILKINLINFKIKFVSIKNFSKKYCIFLKK